MNKKDEVQPLKFKGQRLCIVDTPTNSEFLKKVSRTVTCSERMTQVKLTGAANAIHLPSITLLTESSQSRHEQSREVEEQSLL